MMRRSVFSLLDNRLLVLKILIVMVYVDLIIYDNLLVYNLINVICIIIILVLFGESLKIPEYYKISTLDFLSNMVTRMPKITKDRLEYPDINNQ